MRLRRSQPRTQAQTEAGEFRRHDQHHPRRHQYSHQGFLGALSNSASSTSTSTSTPTSSPLSSPQSSSSSSLFRPSMGVLLLLTCLLSLSFLTPMVQADIVCTQNGSNTFRVDSTVKFTWNNTETVPIDTFTLDIYCYENSKLMRNIATLNTTSSPNQYWRVDNTILDTISSCPLNQYQGRFSWTVYDPVTGINAQGTGACKVILLIGPGVVASPSTSSDVSESQPTDEPIPSQIVITDQTKNIVIGVGSAVGALVLAGFVGFYFIRYKNKRAEEKHVNQKLREPLKSVHVDNSSNGDGDGSGSESNGRGGGSDGAGHYAPLSENEMVELGGAPPARASYSQSRPSSTAGSGAPLTDGQHQPSRMSGYSPSTLSQPSGGFAGDRPTSLLTSPFTPVEDYYARGQGDREPRQQDQELHRQQYEQQLQQQQQQQQVQLQHMQQQQQQQLNYGSY